jgi:hypothetical protein
MSRGVLVDSNVILDVATEDPTWMDWSSQALASAAESASLIVNPVIYAEVSVGFERIEDLDDVLPFEYFRREAIPWDAAFLAGKAFLRYRRRLGSRTSPLPDFFVGAHAAIRGYALLTRDTRRYLTYFPQLILLSP